ncbi:Transmembrane protein 41B [Halotydeus destructor]|nr:Transmembrane protein 41B [Halotydeus destructor]
MCECVASRRVYIYTHIQRHCFGLREEADHYSTSAMDNGQVKKRTISVQTSQHDQLDSGHSVDTQSKSGLAEESHKSSRRALLILLTIFTASLLCLGLVYYNFPKLEPSEKPFFKLPKNIEDAKNLGLILSRYSDRYYFTVLVGILVTYIFLQSFAIPGSVFLSILSGFIFPFPLALFVVCLCSAIGASLCYFICSLVGRPLVIKYLPDKAAKWSSQVIRHKDNLLNYIIFLRITPFLPNWFINLASPVIGVPFTPFFVGTFLGVAPPSFVAIQAGKTLNKLTSSKDVLSWSSILLLVLFASLSVIPVVYRGRMGARFN